MTILDHIKIASGNSADAANSILFLEKFEKTFGEGSIEKQATLEDYQNRIENFLISEKSTDDYLKILGA